VFEDIKIKARRCFEMGQGWLTLAKKKNIRWRLSYYMEAIRVLNGENDSCIK